MGYTHYWYRPQEISKSSMAAIVADFNKLVLVLDDMGVKLADGFGENVPEINAERVWFNGLQSCGHASNSEISIPWPTSGAHGVGNNTTAISGAWFAGSTLQTRACDGDCSYETFSFPRVMDPDDIEWQKQDRPNGPYFNCTKTAFRPYDVAVTAFLVIAKHYLKDQIDVSSDGEDEFWQDAKNLCQFHLGYGFEFQMTNDGLEARAA